MFLCFSYVAVSRYPCFTKLMLIGLFNHWLWIRLYRYGTGADYWTTKACLMINLQISGQILQLRVSTCQQEVQRSSSNLHARRKHASLKDLPCKCVKHTMLPIAFPPSLWIIPILFWCNHHDPIRTHPWVGVYPAVKDRTGRGKVWVVKWARPARTCA